MASRAVTLVLVFEDLQAAHLLLGEFHLAFDVKVELRIEGGEQGGALEGIQLVPDCGAGRQRAAERAALCSGGVAQLPIVGGNPTDSLFGYIHNNASIVAKDVTPLTNGRFLPPQRRGVKTETYGEAKWGGIRCPEPVTIVRMDGVFGNPA